jgi:5-methylthioadenosine/S-adenosylhomocysteine deaminase
VYWGTLLGAAEMLLAGVTAVADHYFAMDQAYRAYQVSGMRADLAWAVFGTGEAWEPEYEQSLEFVSNCGGRDPRLQVSLGPHSLYICPDEFLSRVAADAADLELKLHIHVSEEQGQLQRTLADRGKTPVAALDELGILRPGTILAHAYWATDEDLDLIKDRGAGIAHCAKTYLKFGDVTDLLPRALAVGVPVGLGTDGPCSNNTLDIFETARDAALLAKSARRDPEQAVVGQVLPLVVAGGGLLGLPDYGRIEAGAPADLVLIDPRTPNMAPPSPFANLLYAVNSRNIHTVIVDGRVVVRDGRLLTIDLDEAIDRAQHIRRRLVEQAPGGPLQTY